MICLVSQRVFYETAVTPYLEGAERLNRAFQGVDFHTFNREKLSFKERVFSLITGFFLMLPFINSIIWIFWKTFGFPEHLSPSV